MTSFNKWNFICTEVFRIHRIFRDESKGVFVSWFFIPDFIPDIVPGGSKSGFTEKAILQVNLTISLSMWSSFSVSIRVQMLWYRQPMRLTWKARSLSMFVQQTSKCQWRECWVSLSGMQTLFPHARVWRYIQDRIAQRTGLSTKDFCVKG